MSLKLPFASRQRLDAALTETSTLELEVQRLKEALHSANAENDRLKREAVTSTQLLNEAKTRLTAAAERHAFLAEWAPASLCELPHLRYDGYEKFVDKTFSLAQLALPSATAAIGTLAAESAFKCPSAWALYWLLTHAADDALRKARAGANENAITTAFAQGLRDWADKYRREYRRQTALELRSALLYEHLKPKLQEVDTGADMVLVICGDGLVGRNKAKLVWIQAKRYAGDAEPFCMSYFQLNSKHGTQCAALQKLDRPGSQSLYIHYATQLPFVACILAKKLHPNGKAVLLSEHGARLQELLTAVALEPESDTFSSPREVLTFLEEIAKPVGLPLNVIALDGQENGFGRALTDLIQGVNRQLKSKEQGQER